ncbi:MAG TPA: hypothetical protein VJR58_31410 [Vineibacter sp.]|nr:hypothetical protein [Vineibacter sp.]
MSRNRTNALTVEIETDDRVTLQAANDNIDDSFDTLACEVVAILLNDGRSLLAG